MYNLRKELGKEFVENTINTLHENGHTLTDLRASLGCIRLFFENVPNEYIELYINAPDDLLFNRCAVYIEKRFGLHYASTLNKLFNRICGIFENTKAKYSANETFLELFRILYKQKKQLRK